VAQNRLSAPLAWLWQDKPGFSNVLCFPLTLLSWCYGFVVRLRIVLYARAWLTIRRLPCHLVSIGNITAGGTGKTPMVLYFAESWQKKGYKVGIVSRGYRRKNKAAVVLVSDGMRPCATAEAVGDEPYLMAQRLSGVPIVVSADRYEGCKKLIADFAVDVILLDDAFQHLKLHRDQNLLMIDATNPFGNGHLLPRGPLREPLAEIRRSDVVIFTRVADDFPMDDMMRHVAPFQKHMLQSHFEATALIDLATGEVSAPAQLAGKRVRPICGIGNPEAFLQQLEHLGATLEAPLIFEDHYAYQRSDVQHMQAEANEKKGCWHVTTEKDAVKIKPLMRDASAIYALRIGPVFDQGSEALLDGLFEK